LSIIDKVRHNLELAKKCFGVSQLLGSPEETWAWWSSDECWNEIETFLRKHGYTMTREKAEYYVPLPKGSFQATRDQFHSTVAFYIHELIETEEISRRIGRWPEDWEVPVLVYQHISAHDKAHEMYKEYLRQKGVPLPPIFKEQLLGSPEPEYHICYKCGMPFNPDTAEYCEKCGVLLCPQGHCLCSLGLEAQAAVSREIESLGLWEYSPLYGKRKKRRKH
jgi:hypothetical protein